MGAATAVDTALKVVNLVNDVCALVKSNVVETMPRFASALPPGANPNDVGRWTGWSQNPQSSARSPRCGSTGRGMPLPLCWPVGLALSSHDLAHRRTSRHAVHRAGEVERLLDGPQILMTIR
jgi:hypothetical protein